MVYHQKHSQSLDTFLAANPSATLVAGDVRRTRLGLASYKTWAFRLQEIPDHFFVVCSEYSHMGADRDMFSMTEALAELRTFLNTHRLYANQIVEMVEIVRA